MRVITCFSYKGGAGRTVTAANIAAALASTRKVGAIKEPLDFKVALFDLDVFSAGTHRVFGITNDEVQKRSPSVQDYLMLPDSTPSTYATAGGITLADPIMEAFRFEFGANDNCRQDFTLFPAQPKPNARFNPAKYHENLLLELILELESRGFDYVILDGEAGTRAMADIAIRLADVVLMMFRLTWQHVEGTLNFARFLAEQDPTREVYLIPTCVPLVDAGEGIYQEGAPGLRNLRAQTDHIPEASGLNELASNSRNSSGDHRGLGWFWAERHCVHESLSLKGSERIIVYDAMIDNDAAARDFFLIAQELSRLGKRENA